MIIYVAKISDICKETLDELSLFISLEKKHKINKFINKKDKIRTLIGELIIRDVIAEKYGIKNKNVIFNKNQYGKPYLKNYNNFNFNISHSGDFVVCAISDKSIGIDIEHVIDLKFEGIAQKYFSTKELEYISAGNSHSKLTRFYEIWTLKESYIKCCGKGLSMPLKSFSINIIKHANIKVVANNRFNKVTFRLMDLESDYKMAVCSINETIPKDIIMINQNKLISKYLDLHCRKEEVSK